MSSKHQIPIARELTGWPGALPLFDKIDDVADADSAYAVLEGHQDDLAHWIARFELARISFDRQNSRDLIAQLRGAATRPIDTVLCSTLDTDAAACIQSATAATSFAEVIAGISLIARLVGAERRVVIVDRAAPSTWWTSLRAAASSQKIEVIAGPNPYPQSDPTLLLIAILNRKLRPSRLPIEQGAIVFDAATAADVGAIVLRGRADPLIPLIIRDQRTRTSWFVRARRQATVQDVLAAIDLETESGENIVSGDLLRHRTIDALASVDDSDRVIHLLEGGSPTVVNACIRCGWCFEACPTRVQPATLLDAAQTNNTHLAEDAGLHSCIECGICSYICPSHLPLLEAIRILKAQPQRS